MNGSTLAISQYFQPTGFIDKFSIINIFSQRTEEKFQKEQKTQNVDSSIVIWSP